MEVETLSNKRQSTRGSGEATEIPSALAAFEWGFACWPPRLLDRLFFLKATSHSTIFDIPMRPVLEDQRN